MTKHYLIDTPSPFAPTAKLESFLREMQTLDQTAPEVQSAIAQVEGYLQRRRENPEVWGGF